MLEAEKPKYLQLSRNLEPYYGYNSSYNPRKQRIAVRVRNKDQTNGQASVGSGNTQAAQDRFQGKPYTASTQQPKLVTPKVASANRVNALIQPQPQNLKILKKPGTVPPAQLSSIPSVVGQVHYSSSKISNKNELKVIFNNRDNEENRSVKIVKARSSSVWQEPRDSGIISYIRVIPATNTKKTSNKVQTKISFYSINCPEQGAKVMLDSKRINKFQPIIRQHKDSAARKQLQPIVVKKEKPIGQQLNGVPIEQTLHPALPLQSMSMDLNISKTVRQPIPGQNIKMSPINDQSSPCVIIRQSALTRKSGIQRSNRQSSMPKPNSIRQRAASVNQPFVNKFQEPAASIDELNAQSGPKQIPDAIVVGLQTPAISEQFKGSGMGSKRNSKFSTGSKVQSFPLVNSELAEYYREQTPQADPGLSSNFLNSISGVQNPNPETVNRTDPKQMGENECYIIWKQIQDQQRKNR